MWEDDIREWTGLEFGRSQRAVENRANGGNWLRNHLWCPSDPHGEGIGDEGDEAGKVEQSLKIGSYLRSGQDCPVSTGLFHKSMWIMNAFVSSVHLSSVL